MAQKVLVEMLDDIDGSTASHTVPFALDGVSYEIDLSDENATTLRDKLARFISAGRRVGGRKVRVATGQSTAPRSPTPEDRQRNQQIRTWANANGHGVFDRGRLSSEVVAAFEQAQAEKAEKVPSSRRKRTPRKKVTAAKMAK